MKKLKDIKIYLVDCKPEITNEWKSMFGRINNVEVITDYFNHFMDTHSVQVVVSPANAFGLMDGGYDLAITNYFGPTLQERVQKEIITKFYGEQPVGTVLPVVIDNQHILYHIPTMRYPLVIKDYSVIYQCTRVALMEAMNNDIESIVIPAFGGLYGRVPYAMLAYMMYKAYIQLTEHVTELNWKYVGDHKL